jgi:hypothetical protein
MLIAKSYYAFIMTYRLAFESINRSEQFHWVVIDECFDLIFLAEILINFNKPYYDENNVLETSRKKIAKNYLKGYFAVDVLMLFPISLVKYNSRNRPRSSNE